MTGTDTAIELYNDDFFGIQILSGRAMVSSRDVARVFEKEHYNVIKAIKSLECSDTFSAVNY